MRCDCLDNLVQPDRRIDFIKLDVEGHESGVLRGAKNLFQRDRPTILFECTNSGLTSSGYTAAEVFSLTNSNIPSLTRGYLENGQPLTWVEFEQALQYPFKAFNFIAMA